MNAILTAHGYMVPTISKAANNDYTPSNARSFDAWGNVRIGSTAGNPTGRYCRSGAKIPRRSRMSAANRDASLNRATSIGGVNCTNDVLGNRLTKGSTSYSWDALNRMAALTNSSYQTSYVYRADGMRVAKTGFDGDETRFTRYRYDGQMGIEDYETRDNNQVNGVRSVLTQYGLGARGIDYMKTTTVPGTGQSTPPQTVVVDGYPIYDAHGNMVATLSKSGQNDYALSNQRSFDAWGNVRIGSASGNPTGRYCANIGHKQDDESGLIYMRARYYEPTSGRFVSEDMAKDGGNWYCYAKNTPTCFVDGNGRAASYGQAAQMLAQALGFAIGASMAYFWVSMLFMSQYKNFKASFIGAYVGFWGLDGLKTGFELTGLKAELEGELGTISWKTMARNVRQAFIDQGWGNTANQIGWGFSLGLLFGVLASCVEFAIWKMNND